MMQIRWILITLVVILNTINIKASTATEKDSFQSVLPPIKGLEPGDSLETFRSSQSDEGSEIEKKQRSHSSVAKIQYHVHEDLDKYINTDEKDAYFRIQAVIEALDIIMNKLDHYIRPDKSFSDRKKASSYVFYILSKDLIGLPLLHSFVQEIQNNLDKAIREEEEGSNKDAYPTVYAQILNCCTSLRSMLEKKLKTAREDKLEDSDVKSTMGMLIEKNILSDAKLIAEQLYRSLKKSCSNTIDGFFGVTDSFRTAKLLIKKFWTRALDVRFWKEPRETYKTQLEVCWGSAYIKSAFGFILYILIEIVMESSELGIPIVKCATILQVYMDQIENAFWHVYASEITHFDLHYRLNPGKITEKMIDFIRSQPERKKAIAAVKEFAIDKPIVFISEAFKDGEVSQKALESLRNAILGLNELLIEKYGHTTQVYGIRAMCTTFLLLLIDDLVEIENHGVKINLNVLLSSIEFELQSIWGTILIKSVDI